MKDIIKVKEWKDRQFTIIEPPPAPFKHLTRVERIIDKKIFTQYDEIFEKEFNSSDIPNLEKVVHVYISIEEFLPDLKNLYLKCGWSISKDFYENGKFIKQRIVSWSDEYEIEINDLEKEVEELEKELKNSIKEHLSFINKWEGEMIEEQEET